jgi:acetylornithine deacetylase/succinyl-diaminopimelate desuccinylase-like protein
MAARLKAAGYPDADMRIFVPPGHPKKGGLLAILHGTDPNAKAILLLAHVDVVEAKREDWTHDPFPIMEENGYFYGRGTNDMKAQAAVWVDNMIRFREEGFHPKRSIKLAAFVNNPKDAAAVLDKHANWHAVMRTTCSRPCSPPASPISQYWLVLTI